MTKMSERTKIFLGIGTIMAIMALSYIILPGGYRRSSLPQTGDILPTPSQSNLEPVAGPKATAEILQEEASDLSYNIDVQYPKFSEMADESIQEKLNEVVKSFVAENVAIFKQGLEELEPVAEMAEMKSALSIDNEITFLSDWLISVKFDTYEYYALAAHPNSYIQTLNYDVKKGNPIELKDIFKPEGKYLEIVAEIAKTKLLDGLLGEDRAVLEPWINDGTAPKSDNYKNFGFAEKNIVIYFNPYQVGPYALGIQKVVIPLEDIKDELEPQSVVGKIISL